eukprot:g2967.t1
MRVKGVLKGTARFLRLRPLQIPHTFHISYRSHSSSSVSIRNSVNGKLEPIQCSSDGILRWYNCGPTVYDSAHLGHARTYVCFDVMRRILSDHFRLPVMTAMGITDVDNKIVIRARERKISAAKLAREFEQEFLQDMKSLGVELPPKLTRVSEHIPDIHAYIEGIIAKGHAYVGDDGVYFDTRSMGDAYGRLSADPTTSKSQDPGNTNKRDARDFALWKFVSKDMETEFDTSVTWDSPWGRGRPGWHIECSAMSHAVLGDTFDLHGGGVDLKFPHHCNEVAQSEAYLGCGPNCWVGQFVHTGHLHIDGLKMSKSLKNFITVREMLGVVRDTSSNDDETSHICADTFRIWCMQYKYSSDVHYSDERMKEAATLLRRFTSFFETGHQRVRVARANMINTETTLSRRAWETAEETLYSLILQCSKDIDSALADDFDTPKALNLLQNVVRSTHEYMNLVDKGRSINGELIEISIGHVYSILTTLGVSRNALGPSLNELSVQKNQTVVAKIKDDDAARALREFRAVLRQTALEVENGNFGALKGSILDACDTLRDDVFPQFGVEERDHPEEQKILIDEWENRSKKS